MKVIIIVQGGVVQDVIADDPDARIAIVDTDDAACDTGHINYYGPPYANNVEEIEEIHRILKQHPSAIH